MPASVLASVLVLAFVPLTSTPAAADPPIAVGGGELASRGTVVAHGAPPLPAVTAAGWLVADLDTGEVLAAHDAHGAYAPASTLKVLTALTVIPRLPAARAVTATSTDAAVDGTRVGVVPGHRYSVASLLRGMLMVSGNDAALALGRAAGGVPTTVAAMNAKAMALQAYDTEARTVDGLDAPGQTSSAYDLALLTRAALKLPSFRADVGTRRARFAGSGVPSFEIDNHNPLLGAVPGVYGVKNGYTVAALASYVGTARRGNHDLVVVVMRSVPDFVPESKALFDWGFAVDGRVAPIGTLVGPASPRVRQLAAAVTPKPAVASGTHRGGLPAWAWLALGAAAGLVLVLAGRRRQLARRRTIHLESRLRL